jgi:hypothetical protein
MPKNTRATGKTVKTSGKTASRTASAGRFVKDASASGQIKSSGGASTAKKSEVTREAAIPKSHQVLAHSLLQELSVRDPDGRRLSETDLKQAAALAAERILGPSLLWVKKLGAFYDTEGVRSLLAREGEPITRQAVSKRKGLLALTTGNGRVVYPAFQFDGRRLIDGLDRVLAALPEDLISRWTVASWLTSPEAALDGERPIDVLANDGAAGRDRAVQVAAQWAAQLAG